MKPSVGEPQGSGLLDHVSPTLDPWPPSEPGHVTDGPVLTHTSCGTEYTCMHRQIELRGGWAGPLTHARTARLAVEHLCACMRARPATRVARFPFPSPHRAKLQRLGTPGPQSPGHSPRLSRGPFGTRLCERRASVPSSTRTSGTQLHSPGIIASPSPLPGRQARKVGDRWTRVSPRFFPSPIPSLLAGTGPQPARTQSTQEGEAPSTDMWNHAPTWSVGKPLSREPVYGAQTFEWVLS